MLFKQKIDEFCCFLRLYLLLRVFLRRLFPYPKFGSPNMEIFDCVLLQNTSNVTRGEREIRFQSSLLRRIVSKRLSNELFAEFS